MNFQEEIQKLPAYKEFTEWYLTHNEIQFRYFIPANNMGVEYDVTAIISFIDLPFSFQLGVYLEWLESNGFGINPDDIQQGYIVRTGSANGDPVFKSRIEAYQYGIIEAFKLLSK